MSQKLFLALIISVLFAIASCKNRGNNAEDPVLKELQVGTKALEKEYHNQRYKLMAKVNREGETFFPYHKVYLAHDTILKLAFKHLDDSSFCKLYKMLIKKNNYFFDSVAKAGPKFWPRDYPLFTFKDDSLQMKAIPETYKREFIKQSVLRHWIYCSDLIAGATDKFAIRCGGWRFKQYGFQLNVRQKDTVTQLKLKHITYDEYNEHHSHIEFNGLFRIERKEEFELAKETDLKDQVLFISEYTNDLTIKTKLLSPGRYCLIIKVQTISEHFGLQNEEAVYDFEID